MKNTAQIESAVRLFRPDTADTLRRCAESLQTPVYEIRVYTQKAVLLVTQAGTRFCLNSGMTASYPAPGRLRLSAEEVCGVLSAAADQALFFKENELAQGYLTKDGCRIGICGSAPQGKLLCSGVTSVNIRVPCAEVPLPADHRLRSLLSQNGGLLIAGAPGAGKTTMLKACARMLCSAEMGWRRVAVIDERDEFIAALQADPNVLTADVLHGVSKAEGIIRALRLMNPEVILCDEIGSARETAQLLEGLNSGVRFICSIHAGSREELFRRRQFRILWSAGVFSHAALLSSHQKGAVYDIISREAFSLCG